MSGQVFKGLQDFSVSPRPLGTFGVFELIGTWLGLGLGALGLKDLGPGLDNFFPVLSLWLFIPSPYDLINNDFV